MKPKRPMPPTLLAASIAATVAFHFLLPALRVMPRPWNLLGALPAGVARAGELGVIAHGVLPLNWPIWGRGG